MDFILNLAIQFWPMTIFIILVIIGFIINLFDKKIDNRVNFKYTEFPHMKPIPIATKGKGFWGAILLWFFGTRHWEVVKDFNYSLMGKNYIIPKINEFYKSIDSKDTISFLHYGHLGDIINSLPTIKLLSKTRTFSNAPVNS